ncbi:MAG: 50S ribosomal protein L22 [Candidatus Magasanikbacteria bacterium CG10_big_fil_rev_8_21_14_0_10_42_10]|uniref:Large ribosomal subunit protein uL22 n=2 Tax=Candidatus Magasanikiibacteriota TaxID=1752731 RepID=A0A2H0TVB9_9BACT|nr:MAG: 50S ribosomal protein L22 [Candidatus Magasanikbacteria bacterium CG10_big_fil_rev_8_21_14_0_10_42_10]PIZ94300.1 MAG: 50S ribosomal protein L22 [Candidatus Magasanikbacteria bacterium CG_4_10_14_0_2_um_filter_41_10]
MKRQATAKLSSLRIAPRKVRLLADLIRGMHVSDALMQLKFSKKQAAVPVIKLLRSAVANAEHNANIDIDTLIIKESYVDGGPISYRWMPRAFGRAGKIRKRTSHVTLVLEGEEKNKKAVTKKVKKTKESDVDTQDTKGTQEEKK